MLFDKYERGSGRDAYEAHFVSYGMVGVADREPRGYCRKRLSDRSYFGPRWGRSRGLRRVRQKWGRTTTWVDYQGPWKEPRWIIHGLTSEEPLLLPDHGGLFEEMVRQEAEILRVMGLENWAEEQGQRLIESATKANLREAHQRSPFWRDPFRRDS